MPNCWRWKWWWTWKDQFTIILYEKSNPPTTICNVTIMRMILLGLVHSSGAHNIESAERRIGLGLIIRKVKVSCIYTYIYICMPFSFCRFLGVSFVCVCVCEHRYRHWTTRRLKTKERKRGAVVTYSVFLTQRKPK